MVASFKEFCKVYEESSNPVTTTGSETATDKPVVRRSSFAGNTVFDVCARRYHSCIKGKYRYHRYSKYVGDDDIGEAIRDYGRKNPASGIIVRNESTGEMVFLKRPKK